MSAVSAYTHLLLQVALQPIYLLYFMLLFMTSAMSCMLSLMLVLLLGFWHPTYAHARSTASDLVSMREIHLYRMIG